MQAHGIAGVTRYLEPSRAEAGLPAIAQLEEWLGADPAALALHRPELPNQYDPAADWTRVLVELAALDALGQVAGLAASAFLGGAQRDRVPAYASLPSFTDPHQAVDVAMHAVSEGFRAVKFHGSGIAELDKETVALSRAKLGAGAILMWDGSCAYDLTDAIMVGRALERHDYLWFEAPMPDSARSALRILARSCSVPLVPDGMADRAPSDWARDLSEGMWGALRLDVTHSRTLAHAQRIVRLAESVGLPCEIQSFGYA